MASTPEFVVLTVHAERLHDPDVWARLLPIAEELAAAGIAMTLFVYPARAAAEGKDVAMPVRKLAELGHEIGQHTHFYAGLPFATRKKFDDFSDENVATCLRRDFAELQSHGAQPRGFSAGSWALTDTALEILAELGFTYDCSARLPRPSLGSGTPNERWLPSPRVHRAEAGQIVCLPTSCSLGQWFKWGWRTVVHGPPSYQLVYFHDYDLLVTRTRLLMRQFLVLRRRILSISAAELSSYFGAAPRMPAVTIQPHTGRFDRGGDVD